MNSKVKSIILKSFAIFCSMFALISMAFGAYFVQMQIGEVTKSSDSASFGDWFSALNGEGSALLGDAEGTWKASEAFFIISIITLSLIVIAVVLQFFLKKAWLNLTLKILSIVSLVVVLLAFVLLLTGCIQMSVSNDYGSYSYIPAVGAWLFVIFGLIGSGLGIACGRKESKSRKRK